MESIEDIPSLHFTNRKRVSEGYGKGGKAN
jgi:hypothetical protein